MVMSSDLFVYGWLAKTGGMAYFDSQSDGRKALEGSLRDWALSLRPWNLAVFHDKLLIVRGE